MDSLTQIVLGAACGEVVLGKKIGNKALLFGAIGGTIPDLDVYVGNWLYGNEIDAMLFHRGFMHSILFSVLAAFVLGWSIFKLYNSGKRLHATTQKDWILLFFWSLFTHPVLDCFTPFGTQIFAPFSNYRVAFNNIAVVDVFYTLPFLGCLIVLMFYNRKTLKRRFWLKMGLGISSVYMFLTLCNRFYVDSVLEKTLEEQYINYTRYFVQPSLLSNILWYGVVETDNAYLVGYYSILDSKDRFIELQKLPKQRDLTPKSYQRIGSLAWFSHGYYSIYKLEDNLYQYNDLRYPLGKEADPNSAVFRFLLYEDNDGLNMKPFERTEVDFKHLLSSIWNRTKGI